MTELRELAGMANSAVNHSPTWDAIELGAAWAEVESAVPLGTGWFDVFRRSEQFNDPADKRYCAEAHLDVDDFTYADATAFGPTPAAALRALVREVERIRAELAA